MVNRDTYSVLSVVVVLIRHSAVSRTVQRPMQLPRISRRRI